MRIGKIHRYGEVIELLQYPLHTESTDTGGRLYLDEASHIWSQNTSVVEHLTHRTHLLSACRTLLRQKGTGNAHFISDGMSIFKYTMVVSVWRCPSDSDMTGSVVSSLSMALAKE